VLVALALLAVATAVLSATRHAMTFSSDVAIYLLIVVVTSLVGGFYPALGAAVLGSLLLNYYFVEPLHTLTIDRGDNVVALVIFLLVALLVSRVVDVSSRRLGLAARSSAEAATLSALAGSLLRGEDALPALLARVQEAFAMHSVSLLSRADDASDAVARWIVDASVGADPARTPAEGDCAVAVDERQLVLRGHLLPAADQRILTAFAAQVAVAYRQRELADVARAAAPLVEAERARTALLNAVSHDLRTPIAAAKAAVSSLRSADVQWPAADRDELLATADAALDRLTALVTNLLDLSRLQAGVLPVLAAPVGLDEVVERALDATAPHSMDRIVIDVPADLPTVIADAGLLERVVANLVQNALRYAPDGSKIRLAGSAHAGRVELRVVDRGPGIPRGSTEAVFAAFQRLDDTPEPGSGVGLGLAIARGFTEAMGGTLVAEETPGGGTTMVVQLRAEAGPQ
jgi:two-component system sensor histidine kinase KdpD